MVYLINWEFCIINIIKIIDLVKLGMNVKLKSEKLN